MPKTILHFFILKISQQERKSSYGLNNKPLAQVGQTQPQEFITQAILTAGTPIFPRAE
jgi:hypothetical protein